MPEADRILLVEDDRYLSDIANIHLTNAGYTADAAYSLADALRLFEERSYDLVLLDLVLLDIMPPDGAVRNAGYISCDMRAPERNRSAGAC